MEKGFLTIILHAHLPFVRHPEHDDFLEEYWLYEAVTETYVPLLLMMERLLRDGIDFRLTMSLTPTLASMLLDPLLKSRYLKRLDGLIELTEREIERTRAQASFNEVARMYHQRFTEVREAYLSRYGGDLVQAFRAIQGTGKLEILASAATHGYLPLLSVNPSAVRAQVRIGVDYYREIFGRAPRGFWLPECGYYPGLENVLREQGIQYTILETHGVTRADPRPRYGTYAPVYGPGGLAFFARDPDSSRQVWSSIDGYPGDYDYREFYRDVGFDQGLDYVGPYIHRDGIRTDTGIKYYRITGPGDHKEVYVPQRAEKKAEIHAGNFMFNRERQVEYAASTMDLKPIVVAPYDAELMGHWWFEGLQWLDMLIRKISSGQQTIRLITPSEYLEAYAAHQVVAPSTSSWGYKGYHEVWLSGSNAWIYPHLHHAAATMERVASRNRQARGWRLRALRQAGRELLLAQASDWAFMIKADTTKDYAVYRTRTHLLRHRQLCQAIESGVVEPRWLSQVEHLDNIFPRLDHRLFV
jgi:1,4-alpha-glucan branching enzyme